MLLLSGGRWLRTLSESASELGVGYAEFPAVAQTSQQAGQQDARGAGGRDFILIRWLQRNGEMWLDGNGKHIHPFYLTASPVRCRFIFVFHSSSCTFVRFRLGGRESRGRLSGG
jgi:hypothetical protein